MNSTDRGPPAALTHKFSEPALYVFINNGEQRCLPLNAGGLLVNGGSDSRITVTEKEQVALLALASVALHVTVVVPIGNVEAEGGLQVTVTGVQFAVAVGDG